MDFTAFNPNSPIINSMGFIGGMDNTVPPIPIANIGGYGYNQQPIYNMYQQPMYNGMYRQPMYNQMSGMGGYYNPTMTGYYNPYLAQKQREIQRIQEQEAMNQQATIFKMISKNVNRYLGYEVDDDYLKQYDPIVPTQKEIQCEQNWMRMQRLNELSQQPLPSTRVSKILENNSARYEDTKKKYPDNMSLFDFLEVGGELYANAITDKLKSSENQVNKLYNQSDFRQLLNLHNSEGSYYSQILNFTPDNIDDLEVSLPEHLANSYQERKAKFFNAIFSDKGVGQCG